MPFFQVREIFLRCVHISFRVPKVYSAPFSFLERGGGFFRENEELSVRYLHNLFKPRRDRETNT
jgi:hypothetical protein